MRRVSSEPGEYLNAQMELGFVYAPRTIARLAKVYGVDQTRLEKVLQEVVWDFDDSANFYYREIIWSKARPRFDEVASKIEAAMANWRRAPERIKASLTELTLNDDYTHEQLMADLQRAATALRDAASRSEVAHAQVKHKGDARGTNCTSTSRIKLDPIPDLRPLHGAAKLLFDFWRDEKKELMAFKMKKARSAEITTELPTSLGLRFLYRCLKYLDDRVTVANCVSRISKLREEERQHRRSGGGGSTPARRPRQG